MILAIADQISSQYIVGFIGVASGSRLRIEAPNHPKPALAQGFSDPLLILGS
jgi:hypothetical protein